MVVEEDQPAAGGPLSWFQERMWVHHQRDPESTSYSLPLLLSIRGDLDVPVLEQSLSLIEQILAALPPGPIAIAFEAGGGEGLGLAEGFRGDVLVWLRLDGLRVARCHLRDPSWFQWPLLEAAIEGNIVADFPLCNKSFNCSYSGHDL